MYLNKLSLAKINIIMGTYINQTKAYSILEVAEQHHDVASIVDRRIRLGATVTAS